MPFDLKTNGYIAGNLMVIKFLKERWKRIVLTVAALVVVVATAVALLLSFYWSPRLGDKLKATILKSTDSLYSIDFSRSSLNFIKGELTIDNIDLKPNMAVYNHKKLMHIAPNSLYSFQIKRLVIHHVHPLRLYFDNALAIDQVVISQPDLHISYEQNRDQDTLIKDKKTPYQLISKVLRSVHVNTILLNDVKFSYVDNKAKENTVQLKELNLRATDLLIDSTTQQSTSRFLFCKDVSAELNNISGTREQGRYTYRMGAVKFSTSTSKLVATDLSFKPIMPVSDFFKGNNEDFYSISLDSLRLNNFDFRSYSKYHAIHASSATFSSGKLGLYSNPAPNDSTVDNSINFPQQLLKRVKTDVKIDTMIADRVGIFYTEYNPRSAQSGTVSFERISGKLYNVTNNKTALQKNKTAHADLEAYFINQTKLDLNLSFDLTDDNMPFAYSGSMAPIDLKSINPISMPLGMVKLASGDVKKLEFNIKADRVFAIGTLTALYSNLKIRLFKKNNEDKLKKMGIMSLLANALIIKRDNPLDKDSPRVAQIAWKRRKYDSFFSYMWRSIFMGLKETVGFDTKTEKTVKQKILQFKQNQLTHDARKAERVQKRAVRQQKRELRKQQKALKAQQATR